MFAGRAVYRVPLRPGHPRRAASGLCCPGFRLPRLQAAVARPGLPGRQRRRRVTGWELTVAFVALRSPWAWRRCSVPASRWPLRCRRSCTTPTPTSATSATTSPRTSTTSRPTPSRPSRSTSSTTGGSTTGFCPIVRSCSRWMTTTSWATPRCIPCSPPVGWSRPTTPTPAASASVSPRPRGSRSRRWTQRACFSWKPTRKPIRDSPRSPAPRCGRRWSAPGRTSPATWAGR